MSKRALSIFAGAGSLLLGDWLGWRHVAAVERDAYCRAVLANRYPNLPLHAECDQTPWEAYRGLVDIVTAGWPCQPHSLAGLRLADADERDGWHHVVAALRGTGARFAFLENVAAVASSDAGSYFGGCLADLAELGYDAEWVVLGARDAGAPHGRKRLWILAYARGDGRGERGEAHDDDRRDASGDDADGRGSCRRLALPHVSDGPTDLVERWNRAPLADAHGDEQERGRAARALGGAARGDDREGVQRERLRDPAGSGGAAVADADSARACARTEQHADRSAPQAARLGDGGQDLADAGGGRRDRSQGELERERQGPLAPVAVGGGKDLADTEGAGREGGIGGARRDPGEPRPGSEQRRDAGERGDAAQPALGGGAHGLADRLDWPSRVGDWPAPPGEEAHEWEAPRTCDSYPGRVDAIRALGNGWVTAQAVLAWQILSARAGVPT